MRADFALMETVLARDPATYMHSQRTAVYTDMLCAEIGLDRWHTEAIHTAALLHDVGKVGIPDAILAKPGPLDDHEWEVVRRHSAVGASILESAGMNEIARWVYHLHERFDGGGYPDGLAGEETPFESRLLHAADTLEAMTAQRPYRASLTLDEASVALEKHAGTQLDPSFALPLAALVREGRGQAPHSILGEAPRRTIRRRLSLRRAA